MRLSQIKLSNFRQYKDIELDFPKKDHDLHILIGMNGVGKTTLLNAINWCMYESEPMVYKTEHALPLVNLNSIKEAKDGDKIRVLVKITFEDDSNSSYTIFQRTCTYVKENRDVRKYESSFDCTMIEPDETTTLSADAARRRLSSIVPQEIREFFFFDGERLDDYFSQNQDGQRIRKAVFDISKVETLHDIARRIDDIVKSLRKESSKGIPNLELYERRIEDKNKELNDAQDRKENTEKQLRTANDSIIRCNQYLRNLPNITELEIDRDNAKNDKILIVTDLNKSRLAIRNFIREYSYLFESYGAYKNLLKIIRVKKEKNELPPNVGKELLIEMMHSDSCKVCGRDMNPETKSYVQSLLNQIQMGSELSSLLLQTEVSLEQLISQIYNYPKQRDSLLSQMKVNEDRLNKINIKLEEIEKKLSGYADKDEIKKRQVERSDNEKLLEQLKVRLIHQKNSITNINADLGKLKEEREQIYRKNKKLEVSSARLKWLEKAHETLVQIEENMMNESREEIEKTTSALFKRLVWKNNYFDKVEIDNNFNIWLYNIEGYSCLANISAAERALLALSYTIALHKVSGFEPPLIIDTPVARISDENRRNFAKILTEVSKEKQIVLFFTPSEFSEEIESETYRFMSSKRTITLPEQFNKQEVAVM